VCASTQLKVNLAMTDLTAEPVSGGYLPELDTICNP
jgi:hypothetical protein